MLRFFLFVIPAKAGIHGNNLAVSLDPRFRGGDDEKNWRQAK